MIVMTVLANSLLCLRVLVLIILLIRWSLIIRLILFVILLLSRAVLRLLCLVTIVMLFFLKVIVSINRLLLPTLKSLVSWIPFVFFKRLILMLHGMIFSGLLLKLLILSLKLPFLRLKSLVLLFNFNFLIIMKRSIPRIRTSQNFSLGQRKGDLETALNVSLTVPDMSMSIRTIIEQHRKGLPINQLMPVYYESEIPDLRRLDLVDIDNLRAQTDQDIFDLRELVAKDMAASQAAVKAEKLKQRKDLIDEIKAQTVSPAGA